MKTDEGTAEIEPSHHLGEPLPLLGDEIPSRNLDVVEKDRATPNRVLAGIVETRRRHSGTIHGHQEGRNAACSVSHAPGPAKDHGDVGLIGKRDRSLFAGQHVAVASDPSDQLDRRRVRAMPGLGQRESNQALASADPANPIAGDLESHVVCEDVRIE